MIDVTYDEIHNELTKSYFRLTNMIYILENQDEVVELDNEELLKILGENSVNDNMDNYFGEQVFFNEIQLQFSDDPQIGELCSKLIELHRKFYKMVFLIIIEGTITDYDNQIKRFLKKKYGL